MTRLDRNYVDTLVNRFKGYNSPTDAQKLIIMLGEKTNLEAEEIKKLAVMVRAEKQAEKLTKARNEARDVLNKLKADDRKAKTRSDIIWGSALKTAAKNHPQIAQTMTWLFNQGYISDRDKDVVKGNLVDSHNDNNQH